MPLAALDALSALPSGRLEGDEVDEEGEEEEEEHYHEKKTKKKTTQEQKKTGKQKQKQKKQQQQEEKDLLPWCRKARSRRHQYVQEGTETRSMVRTDPVC